MVNMDCALLDQASCMQSSLSEKYVETDELFARSNTFQQENDNEITARLTAILNSEDESDDVDDLKNEGRALLAGYTDCMCEAIRFLVEEEHFPEDDPVVVGLKQHLLTQQARVILELTSSPV